ncbi:ABC transporter permease [Chloroflexota bacterium]
MLVSSFFAIPMSYLVHRTNIPGKGFIVTMILLQVLLPVFLKTMGWIMLGSPEIGTVNQFLRSFIPVEEGPLSVYNVPAIAIIQGLSLTPMAFLMIAGAFASINPSYEESAEISGASKLQNLRRITLPLVMPSLVGAGIYAFMVAVSLFEIAALLGAPKNIQVFSTLMYDSVQPEVGLPNYGVAGVYGVLLMVPTIFSLFYYQKMLRASHRYATVTGKGYRPKLIDLGRWKVIGFCFILLYFTLDLFLPFLAVLWTSFLPRIQLPSLAAFQTMNLDGYRSAIVLLTQSKVLANTVGLMLSVGFISVFISLIFSWVVLRTRLPGKYAIDTICMIPMAIPSIAFAFSVAYVGLLFIRTIPLYGSLASIILTDTIRRIPFTTRTINGSMIQIHPELEEAVLVAGGSNIVAIRRVVLPLIIPAIFYSFVWAALLAYREVTIALFLQTPRNMVMATAIWQQWQGGNSAAAAAMGVIMVFAMGIVVLTLVRRFPQAFGEVRL